MNIIDMLARIGVTQAPLGRQLLMLGFITRLLEPSLNKIVGAERD